MILLLRRGTKRKGRSKHTVKDRETETREVILLLRRAAKSKGMRQKRSNPLVNNGEIVRDKREVSWYYGKRGSQGDKRGKS